MFFRVFRWSLIITIAALITAYYYGGWSALFLCLMLAILEVSLSFDNAVLNATILKRMSEFWQKIFLTIGIFIAVFGMRLLFPLLIVGVTAHLNPIEAIQLAMQKGDADTPGTYAYILTGAHPQIAAFGGMFLLMLFLNFVFEDRKLKWLRWLEIPLAKIGKLDQVAIIIALITLVLVSEFVADEPLVVLLAGILGIATYVVITSLGKLFENNMEHKLSETDAASKKSGAGALALATGKAGFFLFLYLEILDASFSFDGVIGAFAITSDPIIIALGLGLIGAMFVRSITVYLVRKGSLGKYAYLEHGAHWAIGALAVILLVSIGFRVNEIITGLIGVVFISAAFISSIIRNRGIKPETVVV